MIYPGERHGVSGAKGVYSRTESYSFYYKNLLGKEMPAMCSGSSIRFFI